MLELTDHTALRTPFSRLSRPASSLRMTRLMARVANSGLPLKLLHHDRPVHERRRGLIQRILVDVLDDADDLAPQVGTVRSRVANALTQRRGRRSPDFAGEVLGDDRHLRTSVDVAPRDVASGDHPRADGAEVARRHDLHSTHRRRRPGRSPSPRRRPALSATRSGPSIGTALAKAAALHAGQRRNLVENLVLHPRDTFRLGHLLRRHPHSGRLDIGSGRKSRARRLSSATNVRIIRPDATSRTSASATCTTTSALRVRCRSRLVLAPRAAPTIGAPCCAACFNAGIAPNSRLENSETTMANATTRGSSEMSSTRGNVVGAVADDHFEAGIRERHAQRAADEREHQAFDQHLSARCLLVARRAPSARQTPDAGCRICTSMQIGDVGARDEQHHSDRRHQDPQHVADAADDFVLQRLHDRCDPPVLERLPPGVLGGVGQALSQIGSIRAMSALASATVTPGLRRARLRIAEAADRQAAAIEA